MTAAEWLERPVLLVRSCFGAFGGTVWVMATGSTSLRVISALHSFIRRATVRRRRILRTVWRKTMSQGDPLNACYDSSPLRGPLGQYRLAYTDRRP